MKFSVTFFVVLIGAILNISRAHDEISLDNRGRNLQSLCSVSATVKCMIVSAGVACNNFWLYAHTCRTETVQMTYEWCNNNINRIVEVDRPRTQIDMYDVPFNMNKKDIAAKTCRTQIRQRDIDFCDPNNQEIYGSITLNGWSDPSRVGYSCYAHQYIQTRIVFPSPITPSPTLNPTNALR